MRVYLGSDHAGYELKAHLIEHLATTGQEPVDCGPAGYDGDDDYPPYCFATAEAVIADPGSLGVVIGGSGNGEQIAANKVRGIRCGLAWSEETARLSREHNDAQVVAIGARMHTVEEATALVDAFLATLFSGGERHRRRIAMLTEYEAARG
jgi:ribose 5-phosphate isomerase B